MAPNTAVRITATGTFNTGAKRDITGVVTWATGNAAVATVPPPVVNNLAFLSVPLAATPASTTTVTATSGTVVSNTTTVTVTTLTQTVSNFTIFTSILNQNLTVGTSGRFTLIANFTGGGSEDVTASSDWVSGNSTIATVGNLGIAKGQVTGVAASTVPVAITPTFGGGIPSPLPTVTVTSRGVPNGLTIKLISGSLSAGNQVKYTATASYADTTTVDVTEDTTWLIADPNVAILPDSASQPGQVVAVNTGSTTLTAKFGGLTVPVTVTVP
jgi:hypothetical protein